MTIFGSICTRKLIHKTLICNTILKHFKITLFCGYSHRRYTPLTLFLFSRPLEQLEFIRSSNSPAEVIFVQPILPSNLQRRYRRHQTHLKLPFQLMFSRRSLYQSSRFTVHFKQKLHVSWIQSRKNMSETNIVVVHNHIPQISLPDPSLALLRSWRHFCNARSIALCVCVCARACTPLPRYEKTCEEVSSFFFRLEAKNRRFSQIIKIQNST